jgi:glycosyltransferase involved in cell wall biosynthesis
VSDLLVIIPALNEEATVGDVVRSVRSQLAVDVLVVDDGSQDQTSHRAREAGAMVLNHPFNLGVGAALRTGFRFARTTRYKVVAQVDADGQHDAADVSLLIDRLSADGADIVIGSRFAGGYEVGLVRRFTMRMLSRIVSRRLGVTVTDTTSGFRAFSDRAVEVFASGYPTAYLSDTVEALILADTHGLKIVEQAVQMHERQGGQPSSGSLKSAFHFVRLALVLTLHRFRRPRTQRGFDHLVET